MKIPKVFLFILLFISLTGCARVEKVKAIEGDKEIPYQSLGNLEVNTPATRISVHSAFWTSVEAMTLSLAHTPTRGDHYKRILQDKLAKKAKKYYGADAVIKVVYWPDPESANFPHGLIYARGEMIRYEHFPADAQSSFNPS